MGENTTAILSLILLIVSIYNFIRSAKKARQASYLLEEVQKTVDILTQVQKDTFVQYENALKTLNKLEDTIRRN